MTARISESRKVLFFLFLLTVIGFTSGCKKDKEEESVDWQQLFYEDFVGSNTWAATTETDTSISEPGSSSVTSSGGYLTLKANGCTCAKADLSLGNFSFASTSYDSIEITIGISSFTANPVFSSNDYMDISFEDVDLHMQFTKEITNDIIVLRIDEGQVSVQKGSSYINYTFNTNPPDYSISASLCSESIADCIANALLKINYIRIRGARNQ